MAAHIDTAFNETMDEFLQQLMKAFPRETQIKDVHSVFLGMAKASKAERRSMPREMFMGGIAGHEQAIRAKDNAYMTEHMDEIEALQGLGLKKYWVSPHLPEATREAIWAYLGKLLMLGSTLQMIPPHMMPLLDELISDLSESSASGSASADGHGGLPNIDFSALMQKVMAKMMSNPGAMSGMMGGGMPGLGGMAGPAALPKASSKASAKKISAKKTSSKKA